MFELKHGKKEGREAKGDDQGLARASAGNTGSTSVKAEKKIHSDAGERGDSRDELITKYALLYSRSREPEAGKNRFISSAAFRSKHIRIFIFRLAGSDPL